MNIAIVIQTIIAILIAEIVLWFILAFIHRNDDYNL
jgi:hypothetical protein